MNKSLLDQHFPEALKSMTEQELDLLSYEIRDFLVEKVSKTGGHIASNLGVVELTIALHTVFQSPEDKIVWDVGHQTYVHKILTGRSAYFDSLRCKDGISGFPKRQESVHDQFDAGHASNSISAALGMAVARDLDGANYSVLAVIGDGALTGGIAYEALNNAGHAKTKIMVILNDNGMSIAKNTGGMSLHLNKLRGSHTYLEFKKQLKNTLKHIPKLGQGIYTSMETIRDTIKYAFVKGAIFEELGFKYFGPIDGHNIHELIEILELTKEIETPVMIHVVTRKGKGYPTAEKHPERFHGIGPFDPETGVPTTVSPAHSYSSIMGNKMVQLGAIHPKLVAVSAAMIESTGLDKFSRVYKDRCYDVCIAEQHAVSFAAGLALGGYRPVVAMYSTFLQRAYDQVLEDVCLQNLPVIFVIDRAGIVGSDGETHHGIFDLSYLSSMPNMTILAPKDANELERMMDFALTLTGPCAIRYPRGDAAIFPGNTSENTKEFSVEIHAELLMEGEDITVVAIGKSVLHAKEACNALRAEGFQPELINGRTVKPLDQYTILKSAEKTKKVITVEDNVIRGGFGQSVACLIAEHGSKDISVTMLGWPDRFIAHGTMAELEQEHGLGSKGIEKRMREIIEGKT